MLGTKVNKKLNFAKIKKTISYHKYVYIMLTPVVLYYIVFHYIPIYGALIAFKDFSPYHGILGSPWVGFLWFKEFFQSYYFTRLIRNTILLNLYNLIFGFPIPIIFALLLNEITNKKFKRTVQTITYLPYFISTVVVVGLIVTFTSQQGIINDILSYFGKDRIPFMIMPEWFRTIFVGSGIWRNFGWGSIIYLAALSNINPNLYEAAMLDGASRWQQMKYVTLPGLEPIIVIMLILRIGRMMTIGFEKIILMYNPMTYETADVISTFVYRKGILEMNFSYSTAIGLFNSVINFLLLIAANKISKKLTESSLW